MSWDEIENIGQGAKQKISEPVAEEFFLANFFNTEEGKKSLQYLEALAFKKPPLILQNDGINSAIEMAMREGEIKFYRKIEKIIIKVQKYYANRKQ
jgi:hypothetical protein